MAKLVISDVTSGFYSTSALNTAFTAIEAAIENTVSRDGTAPNNMSGDLDMDSNRILNLPAPANVNEPARLQDILDASIDLGTTNASLVTAAATTNNAAVTVQGQLNNLGEATGAASVGNTPAGSIASTTVQDALNELDSEKQPLDSTLTALAGTLTAANKVPYATALDTAGELDFLDEDNMTSDSTTALASQQSIKAYSDTKNIATQVIPTTAGNVLFTADGTAWTSVAKITSGTPIATTSGTAHNFTGIPSWAKRITVMLSGVSLSGTADLLIQLGDAGGIETTGYVSTWGLSDAGGVGGSSTAGFIFRDAAAANVISGQMIINLFNGTTWIETGSTILTTSVVSFSAGNKTLTDTLTQIRLTTTNGTDTFDAGSVNILYE